ncbi:hypothetical protein M406DRAFT_282668 [Cryphonectria parasitica EP155]|uniref:Uncharacterized protein n=1 Tax=Cryphonectria parasitica (strain ATCC 38755 / EP155) TaxID=660469 RepID=A0A9P5CIN5_CRYP1|nr:uncharacterized protein M406DRAFT_282668 [Cryphonectria parasitica EP155]KAF3760834.1 hypothetical protein M406DRAFT_282668 [Cryphonectria parasitica EP155]
MSSIARDSPLNEDADRVGNKGKSRPSIDDDRTRSPSVIDDEDLKHEDGGSDIRMGDARPTYKSWKKKYRKMRIKFDQLQAQNEELYQLEQKALRKTKQLASYNDRMLDVLLDINNRPQIPTEKRFDLSLPVPPDAEDDYVLPIDTEPPSDPRPSKSLRELVKDIPHMDFTATTERSPDLAQELITGIDSPALDANHQQYPPTFLTADDIDNYLWEIDVKTSADPDAYGELPGMLPTLAPLAREQNSASNGTGRGATPMSSRDFALRNPTSVYNWLRKHAPKTFLQDHESDEKNEDPDEEEARPTPRRQTGGSTRKPSGEARASTGAARANAKSERGSKRSSAAHTKDKRKSADETMLNVDDEAGASKAAATSKGKRKRAVEDDTGYRPKGGSSRRPAKKRTKNNSVGGGAGSDDKTAGPTHGETAATKKKEAAKEVSDGAKAGAGAED